MYAETYEELFYLLSFLSLSDYKYFAVIVVMLHSDDLRHY